MDSYSVASELDRGTFGVVHLVRRKRDGSFLPSYLSDFISPSCVDRDTLHDALSFLIARVCDEENGLGSCQPKTGELRLETGLRQVRVGVSVKVRLGFRMHHDVSNWYTRQLHHPNIVTYVDSFHANDQICIVMEYYKDGNLGTFIDQHRERKESMR
eukprot:1344429-Amorphochlora_amoeboformis.AAC.1